MMRQILLKKRVSRSRVVDLALFMFLLLGALFMLLPMVYAISSSLKPSNELWIFPPRFFVQNPTFKNFTDLFVLMSDSWVPFSRYILNTLFITSVGTFGHIMLASLCAYPLAKYSFPGTKIFFRIVVLSLMFTGTVTAIPNFIIMSRLGWVDTYAAIIVPAFGMSLGLFLMKQFMETSIPDSLLEAAKIDGASEIHIFWSIVMPLVKHAWLTLAIFSIQSLWGIGSSVFIYKEQLKTLVYAFSQIQAAGIARAGVGAAIGVIMMIVPVTVFIITQANIIETMTSSGMKE
jgi:ABC-type glycerol-3-phosphate transport system permease component